MKTADQVVDIIGLLCLEAAQWHQSATPIVGLVPLTKAAHLAKQLMAREGVDQWYWLLAWVRGCQAECCGPLHGVGFL